MGLCWKNQIWDYSYWWQEVDGVHSSRLLKYYKSEWWVEWAPNTVRPGWGRAALVLCTGEWGEFDKGPSTTVCWGLKIPIDRERPGEMHQVCKLLEARHVRVSSQHLGGRSRSRSRTIVNEFKDSLGYPRPLPQKTTQNKNQLKWEIEFFHYVIPSIWKSSGGKQQTSGCLGRKKGAGQCGGFSWRVRMSEAETTF